MLTTQAKLIVAAVLALALGAGVVAFGYHERKVGALAATIAAKEQVAAALKQQVVVQETTFVHDSTRLTRWRTVYDSTRDTLTVRDTVYIVKAVADSAIHACVITLADCRAGWILANARGDSLEKLIGLIKPSTQSHWHVTLGVGAMAALDDRRLHWGPTVAVGWTP